MVTWAWQVSQCVEHEINILNNPKPTCASCELACLTTVVCVCMFILVLSHPLGGASVPYCSTLLCMWSCPCALAAVIYVALANAFVSVHYACTWVHAPVTHTDAHADCPRFSPEVFFWNSLELFVQHAGTRYDVNHPRDNHNYTIIHYT